MASPQYNEEDELEHDIALIKLPAPVRLSLDEGNDPGMRAVCLPPKHFDPKFFTCVRSSYMSEDQAHRGKVKFEIRKCNEPVLHHALEHNCSCHVDSAIFCTSESRKGKIFFNEFVCHDIK